jgi:Uma2 family endonuclease
MSPDAPSLVPLAQSLGEGVGGEGRMRTHASRHDDRFLPACPFCSAAVPVYSSQGGAIHLLPLGDARPEGTLRAMKVIDAAQTRFLTVEEWVQHPDADQYELIDGVLRLKEGGENGHEYAVARVGWLVANHIDRSGILAEVYASRTKYRVRQRRGIMPDVSVVLDDKVKAIVPTAAFNTVGPDLAVEVLSPEQGDNFVEERLGDSRLLDTPEVWFINPWQWIVVGYTRAGDGYEEFDRAAGQQVFTSRLLDGLRFSVQVLWTRRGRCDLRSGPA